MIVNINVVIRILDSECFNDESVFDLISIDLIFLAYHFEQMIYLNQTKKLN